MPFPKITILIRHKEGREKQLQFCIMSILRQRYPYLEVIISKEAADVDYDISDEFGVQMKIRTIQVIRKSDSLYFYNLFCNELMHSVTDGWFFFLDDDDFLMEGALIDMAKHLSNPQEAVICQFLRGGKKKPSNQMINNKEIICGQIGMPCIFLHSINKNIAKFDDTSYADYSFIKQVSELVPTKFVAVPVVMSIKRAHGK